MKPYLLLLAITYCYWCNATCLLSRISIDDRSKNSQIIVDGQVTAQQSFWNVEKSRIYTVNTIQVSNRLKGTVPAVIEIITPGGELDGKLMVVEPNADLNVGSKGIFFLQNNTIALNNYKSSQKQYEIYALAQGFIQQDEFTGKYADPFEQYANQSSVYGQISTTTGLNVTASRLGAASTANSISSAAISSLSPGIISAGTQSVLTITGSGFGTRTGSATIQFRDANSTSGSVYASIPDSSYIISWTNTEIKVIVPGASAFRQSGAGSGNINVIDASGAVISSTIPVIISYNQFEYKKRRISLIGQNGAGGYTFTLNTDFNANTAAKTTFLRALDQWKCKTGVNVVINATTSALGCPDQSDNTNTITFASSTCPLPAGALGITYSTYSLCTGSIMPVDIDMLFTPAANFYYGTAAPASNQYDFESVVLHELGHAFGQGHNSQGAEIMYPSIANGATKRVLSLTSDVLNISEIVDRSSAAAVCGYQKLIKLVTSCGTPVNPVTAQFLTDKTLGCAPLTVQFTDKSTGTPTQWRWDIDNNGATDYTTQNPSHTFTTAGTYTVKLVAINASATDSVVKTAQIIVAPALNMNMEVVQNVSCNGGSNGSLKAAPTGGNGTYTYTWNNNQTAQTINSLATGKYSVTVKDGYNCSVSSFANITQPAALTVSVTTQLTSLAAGSYTALLNVDGGITPYNITLNNSTISGQSVSNLNAGNYAIVVKDKNNCMKTASFSVASPTAIEVEKSFENLQVYPNPAVNNVNINFTLKEEKSVDVELFDLAGQSVFHDTYNDVRDKQASVDLSALANGTYILKFGLPEGNTFRKIIVNR